MERAIEAKADYVKMENVSKFVCLADLKIENKEELFKLDLHPEI